MVDICKQVRRSTKSPTESDVEREGEGGQGVQQSSFHGDTSLLQKYWRRSQSRKRVRE